MERKIIKLEEQAYRLVHHEHGGLTIREAAIKMKLREHIVRRLLKSMKSKAPQLFPMLTKRQYQIYQCYVERGLSQFTIAAMLNTTQPAIQATLDRMKKKGMPGIDINGATTVRYDPSQDRYIKRKF